jgi:hypothetical protein
MANFGQKEGQVTRIHETNKDFSKNQFVYLVGVEGVGHNGIEPIIRSSAAYGHESFASVSGNRQPFHTRDAAGLCKYLSQLQEGKARVVVTEWDSFPSWNVCNKATSKEMMDCAKKTPRYDLVWLKHAVEQCGWDIRFLLLHREFEATVFSHKDWAPIPYRCELLGTFQQYIIHQYDAIEMESPGLWRAVKYEWFAVDSRVEDVRKGLQSFLGWVIPSGWFLHNWKKTFHSSKKLVKWDTPEVEQIVRTYRQLYSKVWDNTSVASLLAGVAIATN